MKKDKNRVVKTCLNEAEAQLALLNLESAGIEAHIHKDDCGGTLPQLQVTEGVKLIVGIDDVEKAAAILNETESEQVRDAQSVDRSGRSMSWGVFFIGVIAGLFISTLMFMALKKDVLVDNSNQVFDINGDGNPDEYYYYEKGVLVRIEEDRNYDGRPDFWSHYESDRVAHSESDDNFDGSVDGWAHYKNRNNFQFKYDVDFDGAADATYYFQNGIKQRVDWHPGNSSIIVRREVFENAIKTEEHIDHNEDGIFDMTVKFNAFEKEVSRSAYGE